MSILNSVRKEIFSIEYYKAGKVVKVANKKKVKLSSNENSLGTSTLALKAIKSFLKKGLNIYPDSKMLDLKGSISQFLFSNGLEVGSKNLILGDGSGEVINMIFTIFLDKESILILPEKSFILYYIHSKSKGSKIVEVERKNFEIDLGKILEKINLIEGKKIVLFANPDNPSSAFIEKDRLKSFLKKIDSNIPVIIDEAYIHFAGIKNSCIDLIKEFENLIIIHTFSKAYGLAGLRVGYGVMSEKLAKEVEKIRLPFNLGTLQQIGAIAALRDQRFLKETLSYVEEGKKYLMKELEKLSIRYLKPHANFIFVDFGERAKEILAFLEKKGITIRHLTDFGYSENYVRITIGLPWENKFLIKNLKEFFA